MKSWVMKHVSNAKNHDRSVIYYQPYLDSFVDFSVNIVHIRTVEALFSEQLSALGQHIRERRLALNLTQQAAAAKAGVAYRTWRRMEGEGKASIEDLVRAAIALRCEQGITNLFPKPAAGSMDELLQQQRISEKKMRVRKMQKVPF